MTLFSDPGDVPERFRGGVVAIGNFDGVHAGHRAVIGTAVAEAKTRGTAAGALTFEPHPRTVFRPEEPVFRITPPAVKREVLMAVGLDFILELVFDRALAARSAADFVDGVLADGLAVAHVVTGFDFHFGKGREGDPRFLAAAGRDRGFGTTIVAPFSGRDGQPVSSSAIRACLEAGDVAAAADLLGYRWFVAGEVVHGEKRGRQLGYPTANMALGSDCRLAHGVYAVRMRLDGDVLPGVASYGRRPQFDNGAPLLETFLFDWHGDLYGRTVAVEFVGRLRPEQTFDSVEMLVAQMDRDCRAARAVLAGLGDAPFGAEGLVG